MELLTWDESELGEFHEEPYFSRSNDRSKTTICPNDGQRTQRIVNQQCVAMARPTSMRKNFLLFAMQLTSAKMMFSPKSELPTSGKYYAELGPNSRTAGFAFGGEALRPAQLQLDFLKYEFTNDQMEVKT